MIDTKSDTDPSSSALEVHTDTLCNLDRFFESRKKENEEKEGWFVAEENICTGERDKNKDNKI